MLGDTDARNTSHQFEAWTDENVRPWYEDHVLWDAELLQRYTGAEMDIEGPLSSDVFCTAGETDPSLAPVVGPVLGMLATPASLTSIDKHVRGMLRQGWRPAYATGPTRDELVEQLGSLGATRLQPTA
jgi:hypothetical protein